MPRRFSAMTAPIQAEHLRAAFDASTEHRLTLLEGDRDDVVPGIHVRMGRGHTPGQQFMIAENKKREDGRRRGLRIRNRQSRDR